MDIEKLYQITDLVEKCEKEIQKISPYTKLRIYFKKESYSFKKTRTKINSESVDTLKKQLLDQKFKPIKIKHCIAYVLKNDFKITQNEIAKYFNNSYSTVSTTAQKIQDEIKVGYEDTIYMVNYIKSNYKI